MSKKRARLSQLFIEGRPLVLPTVDGTGEVVWISKLNPFQAEEAAQAGRVARSRRMLAIREVGTDEYALFSGEVEATSRNDVIEGLIEAKSGELYLEVYRELHSDEDWAEKLEVIEHSEDLSDRPEDDPERQLLEKVATEYHEEILRRHELVVGDYRRELEGLPDHELRERLRDQYVESRGVAAFTTTRQQYELYHCLRECRATPPADDAEWDHSTCDHSVLYLESPEDVLVLPQSHVAQIRTAYDALMVSTDLARFTAGPASSSDSSGPSSSAEGSPASSPAAPSETPRTTS